MNSVKRNTSRDKDSFSLKLVELMKLRGIRPYELEEKTKINKALLSQYTNGKTVPKLDNLFLISEALHVNLFYWLPDEAPGKEFYCLYYELSEEERIEVLQFIKQIKSRKEV